MGKVFRVRPDVSAPSITDNGKTVAKPSLEPAKPMSNDDGLAGHSVPIPIPPVQNGQKPFKI